MENTKATRFALSQDTGLRGHAMLTRDELCEAAQEYNGRPINGLSSRDDRALARYLIANGWLRIGSLGLCAVVA